MKFDGPKLLAETGVKQVLVNLRACLAGSDEHSVCGNADFAGDLALELELHVVVAAGAGAKYAPEQHGVRGECDPKIQENETGETAPHPAPARRTPIARHKAIENSLQHSPDHGEGEQP